MRKSFAIMLASAAIFVFTWLWYYFSVLFINANNYSPLLLYTSLFLAIFSVYLRIGETHQTVQRS